MCFRYGRSFFLFSPRSLGKNATKSLYITARENIKIMIGEGVFMKVAPLFMLVN